MCLALGHHSETYLDISYYELLFHPKSVFAQRVSICHMGMYYSPYEHIFALWVYFSHIGISLSYGYILAHGIVFTLLVYFSSMDKYLC
jgi:hypothetical protein